MSAPPSPPTSLDELRRTVAELVGADASEIADEDDLVLDWALDSVRAMAFVSTLRGAGIDVDLLTLSEAPTVTAWWASIRAATPGG